MYNYIQIESVMSTEKDRLSIAYAAASSSLTALARQGRPKMATKYTRKLSSRSQARFDSVNRPADISLATVLSEIEMSPAVDQARGQSMLLMKPVQNLLDEQDQPGHLDGFRLHQDDQIFNSNRSGLGENEGDKLLGSARLLGSAQSGIRKKRQAGQSAGFSSEYKYKPDIIINRSHFAKKRKKESSPQFRTIIGSHREMVTHEPVLGKANHTIEVKTKKPPQLQRANSRISNIEVQQINAVEAISHKYTVKPIPEISVLAQRQKQRMYDIEVNNSRVRGHQQSIETRKEYPVYITNRSSSVRQSNRQQSTNTQKMDDSISKSQISFEATQRDNSEQSVAVLPIQINKKKTKKVLVKKHIIELNRESEEEELRMDEDQEKQSLEDSTIDFLGQGRDRIGSIDTHHYSEKPVEITIDLDQPLEPLVRMKTNGNMDKLRPISKSNKKRPISAASKNRPIITASKNIDQLKIPDYYKETYESVAESASARQTNDPTLSEKEKNQMKSSKASPHSRKTPVLGLDQNSIISSCDSSSLDKEEAKELVPELPSEVMNTLKALHMQKGKSEQRVIGGRLSISSGKKLSDSALRHSQSQIGKLMYAENLDNQSSDDLNEADSGQMIKVKGEKQTNQKLDDLEDDQSSGEKAAWSSVSDIYEQTTEKKCMSRIPMNKKREQMNALIDTLRSENAEYFHGKEFRFDNRASYFQSIVDPKRPDGFIAAQSRHQVTSFEQKISSVPLIPQLGEEDEKILGTLNEYRTPTNFNPKSVRLSVDIHSNDWTIISFWKPSPTIAASQNECWHMLKEQHVLKKSVRDESSKSYDQCLFTGRNDKVFFFTEESGSVGSQLIMHTIHQQIQDSTHKIDDTITVQKVSLSNKLSLAIRKQLRLTTHHILIERNQNSFSYPDPTIVRLQGCEYLQLTELTPNGIPSLHFYLMETRAIADRPTFSIPKAELMLDCDDTGSVSFLTNKALLSSNAIDQGLEFARLQSPSQVIKISFKLLQSLNQKGSVQAAVDEISTNGQSWTLTCNPDQMIFYRTETYLFPYVEATASSRTSGIAMRYFGAKGRPPVALFFNLVKDIQPEEIGSFLGTYLNREEEVVRVKGQITFKDNSGNHISEESFYSVINKPAKEFKIRQWELQSEQWEPLKSSAAQELPFTLQKLKFCAETGEIDAESVVIQTHNRDHCSISKLDEAASQQVEVFTRERQFKLKVTSDSLDATIEGCYINEPLSTMIIGQYRDMKTNQIINFALQKQIEARITLETHDSPIEFNVTIIGGRLYDFLDQISLQQQDQPLVYIKYAHKVLTLEDEGTFVLHGDLSQLKEQKNRGKGRIGTVPKVLRLTQITLLKAKNNQIKLELTDFVLGSEATIETWLSADTNNGNLIQAVSVTKGPNLQIRFTVHSPVEKSQDNNTLKFVCDRPKPETVEIPTGGDQLSQILVSGLSLQQQLVYYPILAYNSFLPDNSELIVTNVAKRNQDGIQHSQAMQLGKWRFLAFVESPCISDVLQNILEAVRESHCQLFFLAWHSEKQKMRLMMLNHDPWSPDITSQRPYELFVLKTADIQKLPYSLDQLRSVHLLTQSKDRDTAPEFHLLFQFSKDLWSVQLSKPEPLYEILDVESRTMKQRLLIRRPKDKEHVYCLVQKGTRDEVIKIGINNEDPTGPLVISSIYESPNSKLVVLEADPESNKHLFIIDEEQRIVTIEDGAKISGDKSAYNIKANVEKVVDMTMHTLEEEIVSLEKKPFTSVAITNRILQIDGILVSTNSSLYWYAKTYDERKLLEERNLPGTLCSIQHWLQSDGSKTLTFKPLAGTNCVEVMGQYRYASKMQSYVATENRVMVQTKDQRILVFDKDGYLCEENTQTIAALMSRKNPSQAIFAHSAKSQEFGRFFLLKDDRKYTLIQASGDKLHPIISYGAQIDQIDQTIHNKVKQAAEEIDTIDAEFADSFNVHLTLLRYDGEVIMIASAIYSKVEESKTVFGTDESKEGQHRFESSKLFAIIRFPEGITVCIIPCKDAGQQALAAKSLRRRKKSKSQKQEIKEEKNDAKDENVASGYLSKNHNHSLLKVGLVAKKLVLLNTEHKQVQLLDLEEACTDEEQPPNQLFWAQINCMTLNVSALLSALEFQNQSIVISEIPPESILHIQNNHNVTGEKDSNNESGEDSYMQLTIGSHAIVYDMNGREIRLLHNLDQFDSPFDFIHTGFDRRMADRSFETNTSASIAVQRPCPSGSASIAFRAFSELDLQQVEQIADLVQKKQDTLSPSDVAAISPMALTKLYGRETFFSLFYEIDAIYHVINSSLKDGAYKSLALSKWEYNSFLRTLSFVLARPTPVKVTIIQKEGLDKQIPKPCDLSILKQCLLFHEDNEHAMVSIYRIARQLELYLSNYIDCIKDLALIIKRVPAQQYRPLLNNLEENVTTKQIKTAIMKRKGDSSKMRVLYQKSQIIHELDSKITPNDDEIRRAVTVRVLPINKIMPKQQLFLTIKPNMLMMQGSQLLDAIFKHFWPAEKKLISRRAFIPFLTMFLMINFYYMQCLYRDDAPIQGVWINVQHIYSSLGGKSAEELNWTNGTIYKDFFVEPVIWGICIWFLVQQLVNETVQMSAESNYRAYFKNPSNNVDVASIFFNALALSLRRILTEWQGASETLDLVQIRLIASVALVFLYGQLFFWMRTSNTLAEYVDLITQTFKDITYFMVVLLLFLFMFYSGFYMIQLNRLDIPYYDGKQAIFEQDLEGWVFFSGILRMYYLILGDFEKVHLIRSSSDFESTTEFWINVENFLSVVFFMLATFVTQITIFNMLIAIMSVTHEKHQDMIDENSKRQRLLLQAEFTFQDNYYRTHKCNRFLCCRIFVWFYSCCSRNEKRSGDTELRDDYLFVITPRVGEDADEEEPTQGGGGGSRGKDGNMRVLRRALDEKFKEMDAFLNKKVLKNIMDLSSDTGTRLDQLERGSFYLQESLKRDAHQKYAKLRDEAAERSLKTDNKIKEEADLLHEKISDIRLMSQQNEAKLDDMQDTMAKQGKQQEKVIAALGKLEKLFLRT